jgi:uncharacterized membrane protein SirB2
MEIIVSKLWKLISEETLQFVVFLSLSVIVFILTGTAYLSNKSSFQRFFGRIHPLVVVSILIISGLILFSFLLSEGQFAIYKGGNYKGILAAIGLAVPFAAVMILVDRRAPFPANMNVAYPGSLFFYPAMGYVVEILFHILPFCLLYFILGYLLGESNNSRIIWGSILMVALLEPIFQGVFTSGQHSVWVSAYVGLHLFLINIVQLLLFRRYDFITMYAFRLSYYVLWHILWGHLRLNLLF